MNGILVISYIALWLMVLLLSGLVLLLYRQMGEMYLGGKEARTRDGIRLGSRLPDAAVLGAGGERLLLPLSRATLVAFVAPSCGPCRVLMPDLVSLARARGELAIVAVGNDDGEANRMFAEEFAAPFPVVTQHNLWLSSRYRVRSTPFAMYIDESGVVRAKGIVNRMSQLEQLVERGDKLSPPRSVPTDRTTQEVNP